MYTIAERGLNTAIKCVRSAIKYVRSARWKLIDLLSRCALHSTHGEDTFEHLFFFFSFSRWHDRCNASLVM